MKTVFLYWKLHFYTGNFHIGNIHELHATVLHDVCVVFKGNFPNVKLRMTAKPSLISEDMEIKKKVIILPARQTCRKGYIFCRCFFFILLFFLVVASGAPLAQKPMD